ncbi:MAG: pseudouridine synthase, partial [Cyanobacteria bacterium P01_H01_bin.130]
IILDLLPHNLRTRQGLHPVGRLDFNSTGALLLTNDGDFTYRLTHPRFHVPKRYRVRVLGRPSTDMLRQWRRGVMLDDRRTLPAQVKVTDARSSKTTELLITMTEGRNRQIRRTAELLGHPVRSLHREAIGSLCLAEPSSSHPQAFKLKLGEHHLLSSVEISSLKEQIDIISS